MIDPIHRGRRWEAFFEEEGGLRDMFQIIRTTYLERLSQVARAISILECGG